MKQMLQFWAGSSFDGAVSVNDLPAASETLLRGADSTGRRTGPLAKTFVPNEVWGKFVQGVKANKQKTCGDSFARDLPICRAWRASGK